MKPEVSIYLASQEQHLSQICVGYKLLENKGIIKFKEIKLFPELKKVYHFAPIMEVILNNKIIAYDLSDGYQNILKEAIFDQSINHVDLYYKRSYDINRHTNLINKSKIKPLGLNYQCSCKNNPFLNINPEKRGVLNKLKDQYYKMRSYQTFYKKIDYSLFEHNKHYKHYKLLFLCRLWDLKSISPESIQKNYPYLSYQESKNEANRIIHETNLLNQQRIEIVRGLKKEFKDSFIGGIENSPFSIKQAHDLVVSSSYSNKFSYMQQVKNNIIGISSVGLHQSIGWKFAEYVVAGRAILSDTLNYSLPGNFLKDNNYMEYSTIDDLINKAHNLLSNIDYIHFIESNNWNYYNKYLRPDQLVYNTIKSIL